MRARKVCVVGDIAMIPLTRNEYAYVDAEKVDVVSGKNWHLVTTGAKLYAATVTPTEKNRRAKTYLHRLICDAPAGSEVDHINNNGLDNRSENLRVVSASQNKQNRPPQKNNKSGVPGLFWIESKSRWRAVVQHGNKRIVLGHFKSRDEAALRIALEKARIHGIEGMT